MIPKLIKINSKLEIIDHNDVSYVGIVELIKENCILSKIKIGSKPKPHIVNDSRIKLFSYFNSSVYQSQTTVLGIRVDKEFARLVLTLPDHIKKVERRRFFRVPLDLPVDYTPLPIENEYMDVDNVPISFIKDIKTTNIIDISGGGIKISVDKQLAVDDQVLIILFLSKAIKALCRVVRVEQNFENNTYKTSLRFEHINETDRDLIIEYLFSATTKKTK